MGYTLLYRCLCTEFPQWFSEFSLLYEYAKEPIKVYGCLTLDSDLQDRNRYSIHSKGEIWAVMLYEMYWSLVEVYRFSSNWHDSTQMEGNIVALKLVINALKIQPCNPTFLTARDAILSLAGEDTCLVWKAFAKRGLGVHAKEDFVNDYSVPPKC